MQQKLKQMDGFSFIEVIMVILILAIAIPPIIHLFSYNLTNSVDSEIYTKAVCLAEFHSAWLRVVCLFAIMLVPYISYLSNCSKIAPIKRAIDTRLKNQEYS